MRPRTSGRSARTSEALLIPLARAQDTAAPDDVAAGLRARLALRGANITGSYTLAAPTDRLRGEAPWSTAAGGEGVTTT